MHTKLVGAVCLIGWSLGCDEVSQQFFIVHNQVPQTGCLVSASRSNVYRGEGWLDVSLVSAGTPFAYQLHPLLQNDFPAFGEEGASEPNRLILRAFKVKVELAGAPPADAVRLFDKIAADGQTRVLLHYEEPWSGSVDPGGGNTAASVTVVPGELARQIRDTRVLETRSHLDLLVRVRAAADRRGDRVESQEFLYPVKVCQGCLISAAPRCPSTPVNMGNPCNLAQDDPVDCCLDGGALVCPARGEAK